MGLQPSPILLRKIKANFDENIIQIRAGNIQTAFVSGKSYVMTISQFQRCWEFVDSWFKFSWSYWW
jgi:hypothetical protein